MKAFSSIALVGLLLAGCGANKNVGSLYGKVTVDGEAIPSGTLMFMPEDGKAQPMSASIEQGAYKAQGVPVGKMKVLITALKPTGEMVGPVGRQSPVMKSLVPEKYATGIPLEVAGGSHEHDFKLTAAP